MSLKEGQKKEYKIFKPAWCVPSGLFYFYLENPSHCGII